MPEDAAIHAPRPPLLSRQRSHGSVQLRAGSLGGATRIVDLAESGPSRLRFPKVGSGPLEGVLVNTAGGIACGDRFEVGVTLDADADFVLSTTAAEKIYRSDGAVSLVDNRVELGPGARLAWLPQETILFAQARLARRFEAELAADAALLVVELVAFGRAARGERLTEALFEDVWRIRRAGRLTYADTLRLEGPVSDRLSRKAIGGGAGAIGTILDCSPDAERRLEEARAHLETAGADAIEAGASAWNGHLAIRMLASEIGALRVCAARFLSLYRGAPMPRVWQA